MSPHRLNRYFICGLAFASIPAFAGVETRDPAKPLTTAKTFLLAVSSGQTDMVHGLIERREGDEAAVRALDARCKFYNSIHDFQDAIAAHFSGEGAGAAEELRRLYPEDAGNGIRKDYVEFKQDVAEVEGAGKTEGMPKLLLHEQADHTWKVMPASAVLPSELEESNRWQARSDTLVKLTADVKAGKYATLKDVGAALVAAKIPMTDEELKAERRGEKFVPATPKPVEADLNEPAGPPAPQTALGMTMSVPSNWQTFLPNDKDSSFTATDRRFSTIMRVTRSAEKQRDTKALQATYMEGMSAVYGPGKLYPEPGPTTELSVGGLPATRVVSLSKDKVSTNDDVFVVKDGVGYVFAMHSPAKGYDQRVLILNEMLKSVTFAESAAAK